MLAIMLQSTVPAMAAGTVSSNKCGAHVTYSISGSVLTIKGSGAMYDYSADTIPWLSKKDKITSIRVEDGVTVIGSYAFSRCKYVNQVRIPSSVSQIRTKAFSYCDSLENVAYTGSTAQYNRIDIMERNTAKGQWSSWKDSISAIWRNERCPKCQAGSYRGHAYAAV